MKVVFRCRGAGACGEGESLRVVGSAAELGGWDVAAAPVCAGVGAGRYEAELTVDDAAVDVVEYKYVLCRAGSPGAAAAVCWERGENRVLHLLSQSEVALDDVAFEKGRGKWVPCEALELAPSCVSVEDPAACSAEDDVPQPKIVRVFSLPFFNPMTEKERIALRDQRATAEGRDPGLFHVFDGIGRLFTKPVVVNTDRA